MTAPTPAYLRLLATSPHRPGNGWRVSVFAALQDSADALETLTAERDQARQQLADAPHQLDCSTLTHAGYCDCWKSWL